MKKIVMMGLALLLAVGRISADNNLIPIRPVVSKSLPLPANAYRSLENKLKTMAVESGFGALSSPIVLTATVTVLDKSTTATYPVMYSTELEVHFLVADVDAQVMLAETSVIVKGIDSSEGKTIVSAINRINPRTPDMRMFTQRAREKVLEYYEKRVPVILKKARTLAERKEYAEALLVLSNVPEGVEQWNEAADLSSEIYIKMIDLEATELLHKADIALSQNNYDEALQHISKISPQSNRFADAKKMIADIKAENDQIKALQAQLATLSAERDVLLADKAKAMQEIGRFTAAQQEAIAEDNASVEKKLTNWLLGGLADKAVETAVDKAIEIIL